MPSSTRRIATEAGPCARWSTTCPTATSTPTPAFRLALTEPTPTIRPYLEHLWAELPDARGAPVEVSLALLEALHRRWVLLLRSLEPADWERRYLHPEHGREWTLDEVLAMYAWHGDHHTAHITRLRDRMGWI